MTHKSVQIVVQSNSKAILTGENAVVFGATSVACSIGLRNICTVEIWEKPFFQLSVGPIVANFDRSKAVSAFNTMKQLCDGKCHEEVLVALCEQPLVWIQAVLGQILAGGETIPYFSAEIELAMPLGSGLGGSTTSTILVLRALNIIRGRPFSDAKLIELAYFGDQIAHGGSASGTDSGTIVNGGFVSFNNNEGSRLIRKDLPLELLICCSGRSKASGDSLAIFRRLEADKPRWFRTKIREINALSRELIEMLRNCDELDLRQLGSLMNRNQKLLQEMEVSTPEIDHVVRTCIALGALGAKLTGGGCGGVVIMVAQSETLKKIADELAKSGRRIFLTQTLPPQEN